MDAIDKVNDPDGKKRRRSEKAGAYVQCRLDGKKPRDAARVAGYHESTEIREIERPGGPVSRIVQSLRGVGLDEDFLASTLRDGVKQSQQKGAKEKDLNALSQFTKQLSYLLSGGRPNNGPQVAVQINNQGATVPPDGRGLEESLGEVRVLLEALREELRERESTVVPESGSQDAGGDIVLPASETCQGVDDPGDVGTETTGGGSA